MIKLLRSFYYTLEWLRDSIFIGIGLFGIGIVMMCVWALDDNT